LTRTGPKKRELETAEVRERERERKGADGEKLHRSVRLGGRGGQEAQGGGGIDSGFEE